MQSGIKKSCGKEGDESLFGQRDAAKLHNDKMLLLIIGMENQTGIHYAMPLRVLVHWSMIR